jgi:hypothetical protein
MKTTEVLKTKAQWSRNAYLKLVDDKVVFDCSDGEYGPIEFPIEELQKAIEQHNKKLDSDNWIKSIMKYGR